jgi:hypothetical protein
VKSSQAILPPQVWGDGYPEGVRQRAAEKQITAKYAPHSGRLGALTPEDLYLRIIPYLIKERVALRVLKQGKLEVYAFQAVQG